MTATMSLTAATAATTTTTTANNSNDNIHLIPASLGVPAAPRVSLRDPSGCTVGSVARGCWLECLGKRSPYGRRPSNTPGTMRTPNRIHRVCCRACGACVVGICCVCGSCLSLLSSVFLSRSVPSFPCFSLSSLSSPSFLAVKFWDRRGCLSSFSCPCSSPFLPPTALQVGVLHLPSASSPSVSFPAAGKCTNR